MKYLTLIPKLALLFMIIQSCKSQKLKLENIEFIENVHQILGNAKSDVDKNNINFPEMTTYETQDAFLLQYDDVNLTNNSKQGILPNSIYFVTENNDSIIIAMEIDSYLTLVSQQILQKLENRYGKGKVLDNGVEITNDGKKLGSVNYLWEDNKLGKTFLLSYTYMKLNDQPNEECHLFIFKNTFRFKSRFIRSYGHTF